MRLLITTIIAVLLAGCQSVPADLLSERHELFIRDGILSQAPGTSARCIVIIINKNFCGSCTDHAISILRLPSAADVDVITVSDQDLRDRLPDSLAAPRLTRLVIPFDIQQRKGFFSTMNRIYFLREGRIETANYITDETVAKVRRQLTRWVNQAPS